MSITSASSSVVRSIYIGFNDIPKWQALSKVSALCFRYYNDNCK